MSQIFKGADDLDLTSGSIGKSLFYLSLPLIITNLLQTAYNLADTYWLGQYGTAELAAMSFIFPMVFLFFSIAIGLSISGSILVAQNIGAGNQAEAEYAAAQAITLVFIVSTICGAIAYMIAEPLLRFFGAEPVVTQLATEYLQIISIGLFVMFGLFLFSAILRGCGNTITPMVILVGSVILNIVLDPVFIFGFENNPAFTLLGAEGIQNTLFTYTGYSGLGITGAAIATISTRALAMIIAAIILLRGNHGIKINPHDLKPDMYYIRTILRLGVPTAIEGFGQAVSVNVLLVIIGMFATPVVAGYGIAIRIFSVIFLPAIAVEQAVETMTGQNIGAGRPERVKKTNNLAAGGMGAILTIIGIVTFFTATQIAQIFSPDPHVVKPAAGFIQFVSLTFGGIGIARAYTGGFRGTGDTITAAIISIAILGLIRLSISGIGVFQFNLGFETIWVAFATSNIIGAAIAYIWFNKETWTETPL